MEMLERGGDTSVVAFLSQEATNKIEEASSLELPERISICNSAVRSNLLLVDEINLKDSDPFKVNRLEAVNYPNQIIKGDLQTSIGLIKSFPWQRRGSSKEVHFVSLIKSKEGSLYADPTPGLGYSYGTTGNITLDPDSGLILKKMYLLMEKW